MEKKSKKSERPQWSKLIKACIISREDLDHNMPADDMRRFDSLLSHAVDINRFGTFEEWEAENIAYVIEADTNDAGEEYEYIALLSPVDGTDKHSAGFHDCLGVAVTGNEEGRAISFLAHIDPGILVYGSDTHKAELQSKFTERLEELIARSDGNSIDIGMFAGQYTDDIGEWPGVSYTEEVTMKTVYQQAVTAMTKMVSSSLKTIKDRREYRLASKPIIIAGPSLDDNPTDVLLETEKRHLFMVVPQQPTGSSSLASYDPANCNERYQRTLGWDASLASKIQKRSKTDNSKHY